MNDKKPEATAPLQYNRVSVVYFTRSVVVCGTESESASLPPKDPQAHRPGNSVDQVALAYLGKDGSITADNPGPADGLVFRKSMTGQAGKRVVAQTFVPWSNVRCVAYGEG